MALIIALVNKSNLADVSDYKYEVMIGDGTTTGSKVLAAGKITGHRRSDGWKKLVKMLLEKEADGPGLVALRADAPTGNTQTQPSGKADGQTE